MFILKQSVNIHGYSGALVWKRTQRWRGQVSTLSNINTTKQRDHCQLLKCGNGVCYFAYKKTNCCPLKTKRWSSTPLHVNLGYRESNPGLLREQSLLRSESQRCYRYTIPDLIVSGSDRDCWLEVGPETEILSLSVHQLTKTMEPLRAPYPVHVCNTTDFPYYR